MPLPISKYRQSWLMRHYSTLAGPIQKLSKRRPHEVNYVGLVRYDNIIYRIWTRIIAYGACVLAIGFAAILFQPDHWIVFLEPDAATHLFSWVMLSCLFLLQLFVILGTTSATRATLKAKDPVPTSPVPHLNIAFATTRAPGEPIEMVYKTLSAMKEVRYKTGTTDVWLLDETKDRVLKRKCKELDVNYFTRQGVSMWNAEKSYPLYLRFFATYIKYLLPFGKRPTDKFLIARNNFFAAKSKHGNFNSWLDHLKDKKKHYDILAGVDTDQVPEVNYLERLLGYFRDENVAYVVGPQVYGNCRPGLSGLVARWADSQASFFQSTVQRAANATNSAMFVGTNYVVRTSALTQIGGIQPCITEDMATGLAIHSRRNPDTGKNWKSVYTPDVLAVGEGPNYWGPYFSQQWRWAAGTFDTWKRMVWKVIFKLPPRSIVHYLLILTYYPIAALSWLLAVVSSLIYLTTGTTAILAPWNEFLSLYLMNLVMQLGLYFWNRRYSVSPHEQAGTLGIPGILISTITAPIYLSALFGILRGRKPNFQVTTKGDGDNPDWFSTFKIHLQWAALLIGGLVYGITHNHDHPAMLIWTGALLLICLTPLLLGMAVAVPYRLRKIWPAGRTQNV